MFAKLAIYTAAVFSVLAVATPVYPSAGTCSTGTLHCCNQVQSTEQLSKAGSLSLLGIDVSGLTGDIAAQCSPLNVIGVGAGNACSAKAVCCQSQSYGGVINAGCVPVSL